MEFCESAQRIVENVAKTLCADGGYALVVGGGYSYRSTRYSTPAGRAAGDIDLLLILNDIDALTHLFTDENCAAIDFAPVPETEVLQTDAGLFRERDIAVVRVSGFARGCKVGINVTTFDVLSEFCRTDKTMATNKVAHSPTYSVISAAGTDGSSLVVAKVSPDISTLYPRGTHVLILDKNWYRRASVLHAGTYTDFMATGTVLVDTSRGDAASIQDDLLRVMVRHASEEMISRKSWDEMFANAEWFAPDFRRRVRARCEKLLGGHRAAVAVVPPDRPRSAGLLTVFADTPMREYYRAADRAVLPARNSISARHNTARADMASLAATREGRLRLINAEVLRLGEIVRCSYGQQTALVPSRMTLDDLLFVDERLFYRSDQRTVASVVDILLIAAGEDFKTIEGEHDASTAALVEQLTALRVDVAMFLARSAGRSVDTVEQGYSGAMRRIIVTRRGETH